MGFDLLVRFETIPRLTSMLCRRPSHISEKSVVVDARAFTTPVTSPTASRAGGELGVFSDVSAAGGFDVNMPLPRRVHHSAPIDHSLS